jgi:outer membrane receptor for ferrienterochelin and colicins
MFFIYLAAPAKPYFLIVMTIKPLVKFKVPNFFKSPCPRQLWLLLILAGIAVGGQAQQTLIIKVTAQDETPVAASISISSTKATYATDTAGAVSILFPANGRYTIATSAVGHEEKETRITIPYISDTLKIELEGSEHELEEVIVQSTRTSRTIANVPTRVETIGLEEIDEKNNMRPGNVAMLLHESTGILVQQTSATSGNASIRIQGLDGRYTQLLKDGFPNFGAFSSGLSVLEIPPLDLKQVEIIKGPASPLFGGGAIAGVINFISKTPKPKPEYNFILNASNIGQRNIGGFFSGRRSKLGYTVLALYNHSKAYDVDGDEFTEVPESDEYTIHPKLFFYPSEKATIQLGNSFTKGTRTGGDLHVLKEGANATHQYFETNKTLRNISTAELELRIGGNKRFVAKQSFAVFDRAITIPAYVFAGIDYNAYTDVSYITNKAGYSLVVGGNFIYNNFREKESSTGNRDNKSVTGGVYAQHTWDASNNIKLESGLRLDGVNYANPVYTNTEFFVLPRVSLLVNYNRNWTSRLGGGIGYKTPTLFTEQTETLQYRSVAQLTDVKSEQSYGGTADVNFRTGIGEDLTVSFNHMFFYTIIGKPLMLEADTTGYRFINAAKPVTSKGFETNARFIYKDVLKLFLGYTFTQGKATYQSRTGFLHLVPKHKLNTALIYEKEDKLKLGLEGYFTGRQYLSNGTRTPAFEELGFMAEKIFSKFSVYVNFENFTDTRQSRYKGVVSGSHLNPTFDEIWTHTEGFVFNGGIKLKL